MPDLKVSNRKSDTITHTIPNVSNLRCSWELEKIGLLSCDIPYEDLKSIIDPKDLIQKWVRYTHPTLGMWGGVISSVTGNNGIMTLDCESWISLLRGATIKITLDGNSLVNALRTAIENVQGDTGISWGVVPANEGYNDELNPSWIDDTVPALEFYSSIGGDVYESIIPSIFETMKSQTGWRTSLRTLSYNVSPARVFTIDYTFGRVQRDITVFSERKNIVDATWSDDIEDIYNRVTISGGLKTTQEVQTSWYEEGIWGCVKRRHGECVKSGIVDYNYIPVYSTETRIYAKQKTAVNQQSINKYGPRDVTFRQNSVYDTEDLMQQMAQLYVNAMSRNEQLVTIETIDDGEWSTLLVGDLIRVELPVSGGYIGDMVARTMAFDATTGTLMISGESQRWPYDQYGL